MLVSAILKDKADDGVVTVAPGSSVAEAAKTLSSRKIGAVVVSGNGKSASGILSERDIVRALGVNGPGCLSDPVETLMTSDLVTATREESVESVLGKMTEGRFRHIPVMQGADMIGLISIGDVVKAQLSELAMEKAALEGMIKGF